MNNMALEQLDDLDRILNDLQPKSITYVCFTCKYARLTARFIKKDQFIKVGFINGKRKNIGIVFTQNSIFYDYHINKLHEHDWFDYEKCIESMKVHE